MDELLRLCARQHGLFTRQQWMAHALTAGKLAYWLSSGRVYAIHPGVYAFLGSTPSHDRAVMAACLAVDGVAAHRCAAHLWQFRRFERPLVEVLVARGHAPVLPGVVVHRTSRLDPQDQTVLGRIPITTRPRTLLDVAGAVPQLAEGALDGTLHRRQVRLGSLVALLERAGRRHPGRPLLQRLVAERVAGRQPTESELEDDFLRLVIRAFRLPEPVPQHPVGKRRIDFAYPELVFGIEIDSVAAHAAREDIQRNAEKANDLLEWRVMHFTHDDVNTRPAWVAERVREVLETEEARRRPTAA